MIDKNTKFVRFSYFDAGSPFDEILAQRAGLKVGRIYTVLNVDTIKYSGGYEIFYLRLKEFPASSFDAAQFEPINIKEHILNENI